MATEIMVLPDLHSGDEKTIKIATTVEGTGAAKNVTTGTTFLCANPDRMTEGAATAAGSTTALIDSGRAEADDFWIGLPLIVTHADGTAERTEVTDFVSTTHTLTFYAIAAAAALGDTYRIEGYPVLPQVAASTSGNEGSVQLTPANALGAPGRRVLIYHADFGTDAEEVVCTFHVVPSAA